MTTENIPTIGSTKYDHFTLRCKIIHEVTVRKLDVAQLRRISIKSQRYCLTGCTEK